MDSPTRDTCVKGIKPILRKGHEFTNVDLLFGLTRDELIFPLITITYLANKITR